MAKKPVQAYIEESLKNRVEKIFDRYGLDTATAIRMFFNKVDLVDGIPFELRQEEVEMHENVDLDTC